MECFGLTNRRAMCSETSVYIFIWTCFLCLQFFRTLGLAPNELYMMHLMVESLLFDLKTYRKERERERVLHAMHSFCPNGITTETCVPSSSNHSQNALSPSAPLRARLFSPHSLAATSSQDTAIIILCYSTIYGIHTRWRRRRRQQQARTRCDGDSASVKIDRFAKCLLVVFCECLTTIQALPVPRKHSKTMYIVYKL